MTGSLTLADHPGDIGRLACERCGRAGRYRQATLIERYGADVRLADLRDEIAKCDRHGMMHNACGARYLILTA